MSIPNSFPITGKRILIGISTYNDVEHLGMLLQSIDWYTYPIQKSEYDVVVCDDGSRPEMRIATRSLCSQFGAVYLQNETNMGIPATWNRLANALGGLSEIIVLLNNDLLMVPNWLRVMIHFLDANKDNPHVGSAFWNPYNQFSKDMMRCILDKLEHVIFKSADAVSGSENWFDFAMNCSPAVIEQRQGDGQGLGRVMCPCGCCFGFRREVWDKVGEFDERLTSFHEESDHGTRAASMGMAAFGFAYPRPYHAHGYTFGKNPELHASARMIASRKLYREIWSVPDEVPGDKYFDYVNQKLMPSIPQTELKFLTPDYDSEPEQIRLPGGEIRTMPRLVEKVGTF